MDDSAGAAVLVDGEDLMDEVPLSIVGSSLRPNAGDVDGSWESRAGRGACGELTLDYQPQLHPASHHHHPDQISSPYTSSTCQHVEHSYQETREGAVHHQGQGDTSRYVLSLSRRTSLPPHLPPLAGARQPARQPRCFTGTAS